ncbi:hypothetical protein [Oricola indica]|jgi:hypothetical protein|uniref:hypothetical protein n=1 Tax=Oricola indica TaxID=2872591 RepID=UPI001CBC0676|nr:hypothetical protein [Oricola indica]
MLQVGTNKFVGGVLDKFTLLEFELFIFVAVFSFTVLAVSVGVLVGAIDLSRDDLLATITRLFVLAGIRTGRSVIMLPRALRIDIVAILHLAEFAVRRLIAVAAYGVEIMLLPSGGCGTKATHSVILGHDPRMTAGARIAPYGRRKCPEPSPPFPKPLPRLYHSSSKPR